MTKRLCIIGAALVSVWAVAFAQSTPSVYTVQWCNGRDAGWVDGGAFDGGVCADGGTSCQACSGTCLTYADGGTACGMDPFLNVDSGLPQSFPWPTPTQTNVTPIGQVFNGSSESANLSCQLQGSNTGTDPWVSFGTAFTLTALHGANADGGADYSGFGYPFARELCTGNSDGGTLVITVGNK